MGVHIINIGFNYEGTSCELPDCRLDADGWAERLGPFAKSAHFITGDSGYLGGLLGVLSAVKKQKRKEDVVFISYSGHGTTGIVAGKPAQGIVLNDLSVVWEFKLRQYLADLSPAVFFADCCYAKGLDRSITKARTVDISQCVTHEVRRPSKAPPAIHVVYYASTDKETAASTGHGGAMSLAGFQAFDERGDATTFEWLAKRIKKLLPSDELPYEQHPSFVCRNKSFAKRTLKSFVRAA